MKELKTFNYQTTETGYYHIVNGSYYTSRLFANEIVNLKKYLFIEKVKELEKEADKDDETVDEDDVENIFYDIFEMCNGIEYSCGVAILNTDTDDWRSLDVDGNEIDADGIYYQVDETHKPWLFKKIDNIDNKFEEYYNKYHLDVDRTFDNSDEEAY